MTSGRKDCLAVLVFLGLLGFFYPGLFLIKTAPLIGDSIEQHYPWAFQLASSLKHFRLPFWTPLIQCGFPLVAESQVGAFYLPNLLFLGLLPFKMAYSYMNLLHWFIAGWGTYAYAKRMKLEPMGAFVAALVFVFGSAYGGAYYNMTSLKTVCWFPVALYFLEGYLEGRKKRFLFGMAVVIGQSLVAGYLQMAVLTWVMFGAYAVLRIFIFGESSFLASRKILVGELLFSVLLVLLLALPQIYLTFQLAMTSNRTGLEEGYAYVGSMSPFVLGTLVAPKLSLILRGNNLYMGSFALFLVFFSFCAPDARKNKFFRLWSVMTLLAFLLALGRWSPLYVLIVKVTKFYVFRFPAKFLGFICFGLAMMSAFGFQALWKERFTQAVFQKAVHLYLAIVASFVAIMLLGNLFLTAGKDMALRLGEFYVSRFLYAQPGHPHSLETYFDRVKNFPSHALKYISLSDPANVWMIVISCFCAVLLVVIFLKRTLIKSLLILGVCFLVVDLYAASFLDIQYDLAPYNQVLKPSPILEILDKEKSLGQLGRIYGFRSSDKQLIFSPSQNMLYGFEDIGLYSPLVSKRYNESIGLLGNVNDSNNQQFPSADFILQRLPLLGSLNVSHILSSEPLEHATLRLIGQDHRSGTYVYKNMASHHPAYFISRMEVAQDWDVLRAKLMAPHFDPAEILLLEKDEFKKIMPFVQEARTGPASTIRFIKGQEDFEEWQIEVAQAGLFVIPKTFYPGWTATVNGQPAPILKADGLFRAIRLSRAGSYQIQFRYKPFSRDNT